MDLRWLGGHDDDCDRAEKLLQSAGQRPVRRLLDQTAVIEFPATWDEYLASRTSKHRNNLKRWRRRTEELGEIRYQKFRPALRSI